MEKQRKSANETKIGNRKKDLVELELTVFAIFYQILKIS